MLDVIFYNVIVVYDILKKIMLIIKEDYFVIKKIYYLIDLLIS